MARTRHRISGAIDENTPEHILGHPVLGKHLEEVGPNAKPYLPEMHRVSLPEDPTPDQIAVAKSVGIVDEAKVVLPAKAESVADTPNKIGKD